MKQEIYNLKQLENVLHLKTRTIREYIKKKELRAYKVGKAYIVYHGHLLDFIEKREAYPGRKKGAYPFKDE